MARYNRDFLVPYLRDVYYIECVGNRLNNEISEVENDIKRNNYELNHITPPQKPQMGNKASYSEDGGIMVVVVAIIALVINIYIYNCINKEVTGIFETIIAGIMTLFGKYTLLVIFFIINAILFWIGFSILYDVYKYNKNIKEEYKQNMNKYRQELSDFKKNYNWIVRQYQERGAALEQQRQYLVKRRKEAAELSKDLYDINIIPSRFRNIYPIAYLYDYFSTSREDDLDKIIQTMLLEKIIEQLKSVIGKMNEALENQREQIALLSESNEIAERSRMDNINHLLAIERNQEKREDYERMTVANSLVTNFILADMQRQVSDIQYRL